MGQETTAQKRIILTGGGTAGHVTPNLALVPKLRERGYDILYIGSYHGIEKELIEKAGISYRGISSGKLRRYFDLKNFTDPFRVLKGYFEAKRIIRDFKPDVIFSKGGFVAVPVTMAAKRCHVPVISHESDMTPGLANKLSMPSCTKICCNFPETLPYLPKEKAVLTGSPIRAEILQGNRERGLSYAGLSGKKPVLLVIGGSLGSVRVNEAVRGILPKLLQEFDLIHICGKGNVSETLLNTPGYVQYAYVSEPLPDLFAAADLMISRAGANAICEILALKKPNLLIPLGSAASRGDQILNAESFARQGFSKVLMESELCGERLLSEIRALYADRADFVAAMEKSGQQNGVDRIVELIEETAAKA